MKLGRLLVAAVLLAGLSAAVWFANRKEKADEGKPSPDAPPKILTLTEANIRQVELKRRDGAPTVLKKDGSGKWSIAAPQPLAADQTGVSAVTGIAANLVSDRLVDDKVADLASYGLAPAAVEVTFTMADGKTPKLLLGDATPTGSDAYVNIAGDSRLYTVPIATKNNIDKTYKDLRDKQLLTFDSDKISRVELTAKKQTVEFGRVNQTEWQILKPKPMRADGLQVEELVRKLKEAAMDTSVSDDDAKKAVALFASAPAVGVAKVTTDKGTQTLEVRKSKDDYYAKSSVVDGVFKVSKDLGDGLDKSVDDFRNKKIFDFGFNDPNRIEFKDGAKSVAMAKSGDKWWSAAGKELDATSVQAFIDKLRDLAASKFPEGTAFGVPAVELTVVSNDGKRTEKVQVAPTATANFYARREGDPTLYELEVNAVQDLRKTGADVKEAAPPTPEKKK